MESTRFATLPLADSIQREDTTHHRVLIVSLSEVSDTTVCWRTMWCRSLSPWRRAGVSIHERSVDVSL